MLILLLGRKDSVSNHQPEPGYVDLAFFGKDCDLEAGESTQCDAANNYATKHSGAYVVADEDGFWVFGPKKDKALDRALGEYIHTPVREHIERWKRKKPWMP